jgi:hypothetical protein
MSKMADETTRGLLREAVAEVRGNAKDEEAEGTAAAEATDESPTPPSEGASSTEEETTETTEAQSEAPEGTDEPPMEYFGQDLSEFDADARRAIIARLSENDKHIQRLQRERATAEKAVASEPPPAAEKGPEEVNEQSIAEYIGLDLDDPDDARVAKVAVPLVERVLSLTDEVQSLKTGVTVRETEAYWTQGLTGLEAQFGKLPEGVTYDQVIQGAAENGIAEPQDAYWRIMGPARQEVMDAVRARREEVTKTLKGKATQAKPKSEGKTEPKRTADTVRKGVAEVFEEMKRNGEWSPLYEDND